MKRLLPVALVLAASCTGHIPVAIVLVPPVIPPVVVQHDWIVPLSTPNGDRICVQTVDQGWRPCWTVGQLRVALISVKAE